ncbi:MAG: hypothetical protein R2770_17010 [Acidimicrobiales bacterium]|nr:hypothetical protein [Acidimicrobiales bacterium]
MLSMTVVVALLITMLVMGLAPGVLWIPPARRTRRPDIEPVQISHKGSMDLTDDECLAA